MTDYRVVQLSNEKFVVQYRSWWHLWWGPAFWQELNTREEAELLQAVFEKPREALPSSKARTRLLIQRRIHQLVVRQLFIESQPACMSRDVKIHGIDVQLRRLYRIYEKLLTQRLRRRINPQAEQES